jgi:2'-5' RNA ligase
MRLFVAIMVPDAIRPAISHAAEHLQDCMGVRLLPPGDWHLTLRFIGDADEDAAKRMGEALAAVKFAPFTVRLSGAGAYPDTRFPRAIFVGGESDGARALAAEIEKALMPFGLRMEKFSVHVTVARSKGAGDIDAFLKNTGEVGSFEVKSFALVKSRLMAHAAAYDVLREYPAQESGV